MFESNLLGTHPKFYKNAAKSFTLVHEMNIPLSSEQENRAWDLMVDKYDDRPYDFMGLFYLGYYKLVNRLFGTPIPEKNKWQSPHTYFCDELYQILQDIGYIDVKIENGMLSPHDLWLKLNSSQAADPLLK